MPQIAALLLTSIMATAAAAGYSPQHDAAQKRFQGNEEPTAKDATWTSPSIFKVGLYDDGSSRDGYAQYVCMTLNDYGFKEKKVWVQIIDIVKLVRDDKWVKIGEAHCQ